MTKLDVQKQRHFEQKQKYLQEISWKRRAKDTFDEYYAVVSVLKKIKYIPSLLSVVFAFTFINWAVSHIAQNFIVSGAITIFLLVSLEFAKSYTLGLATERKMNYNSSYTFIAAISLIFLSASVFSSWQGSKILLETKYKQSVTDSIELTAEDEKQKTISYYDNLINELKQEQKDYKNSNTFRGTIVRKAQQTNNQFFKRIEKLEDQKQEKIREIKATTGIKLIDSSKDYEIILTAIVFCSLFIELLIVALNLFINWYEVKVYQESQEIESREESRENKTNSFKIDTNEPEENVRKIGFVQKGKKEPSKYEILYYSYFVEGIKDRAELAKLARLNPKQIKEFIEKAQ